jgi:hypothetical protein
LAGAEGMLLNFLSSELEKRPCWLACDNYFLDMQHEPAFEGEPEMDHVAVVDDSGKEGYEEKDEECKTPGTHGRMASEREMSVDVKEGGVSGFF